MDDRKKQIGELEKRKKEQIILLDTLLTRFGENIFSRMDDSALTDTSSFTEMADYHRFLKNITDSEISIQAVEEQVRRFKELEENIHAKTREESVGLKELSVMYGLLGKLLLDASDDTDGDYAVFCVQYRDQADALLTKVLSLEDRLADLEQREGSNVFAWIGKSAQVLVLRSFLTKAQENLEHLRRNVGERYSRRDTNEITDTVVQPDMNYDQNVMDVESLCEEIQQKRAVSRALSQDLETLKEEKKNISGSFNSEGGPLKQIQTLKNHITRVRDDLKSLFRRIGAETASIKIDPENDKSERRQFLDSLLHDDDREILDDAARINESINNIETSIEKLKASLAIDDEKAKIDKFHKMIQDRKSKITQAEIQIAEFESGIKDAEANIEKLGKLL
ncbi:MAG: hypothetical protein FWG89_08905 [Treponema sp.]|nr:hypothetical protein [Treponema sp.]